MLQAIDVPDGKVTWSHTWTGSSGALGACSQPRGTCSLPATPNRTSWPSTRPSGTPLWHARLNTSISNGPITYALDGTQYVVVAAGDSLYAFGLKKR